MLKAYIGGWEARKKPEEQHIIDYWFAARPEDAAFWPSREEAQNDCAIFERQRIRIPSSEGGMHVLTGFEVEQRAEQDFIVFCMGPFIPQAKGESSNF
jgi:hypothetical protein